MENEPTDKLIEVRLYSPHECDYIYRRENNSYYALRQASGKDRYVIEIDPSDERWNIKA